MIWRDFSNSVIKRNIPRRMVACLASKGRGKAPKFFNKWQQSGHWGVAQACNCHSILDAIASLIEAQRLDLAIVLIEKELNFQT